MKLPTRIKPICLYFWCISILWGHSLLCHAADLPRTEERDEANSQQNSTFESIAAADPDATFVSSLDTNTRKPFLFRMFQRRKRRSADTRKGKRRREVKERTAALALKMNEKLEEARQVLLDRMAAVSFNLINYEHDAAMNSNSTFFESEGNDDDITPQSDLSLPNRSIYVVTTAALPWRTGTAVNPLLRAAYLCRRLKRINSQDNAAAANTTEEMQLNEPICQSNTTREAKLVKQYVTLVIPWLELEEDRLELYGANTFSNPEEQEAYIRDWLKNDANMAEEANPISGLKILFYPARYHSGLKSIFAMGDICAVLRNQTLDGDLSDAVCILEEPEHLNWYRAPGEGWTKVFNYVVGIVHTNYIEYASTQFHGLWTAPAIQVMSSAMVRAYCHKVIKLSGVLQTYAPEKETIQNVHGVRQDFIQEGIRRGALSSNNVNTLPLEEESGGQVYYIGKILWAKGFDLMLELQKFYHECTGNYFAIDIIGGGPDLDEIKRAFYGRGHNSTTTFSTKTTAANKKRKLGYIGSSSLEFDIPKSLYELRKKPIPAKFLGPLDHAALGKKYKVFVNPSVSEVLCTTTFEALAMGKFAIIPVHESNKFFLRFPNCLGYRNKWEFAASLRWALTHEPEPLTAELANEFTWEAATDRLIQSAAITRKEAHEREKLGTAKLDERIAFFHNELGKGTRGDTLRKVLGGGPIASQARYEMLKQGIILDEVEENNGGVSIAEKFKTSSFVQAIKSSFSTNIQPRYSAS